MIKIIEGVKCSSSDLFVYLFRITLKMKQKENDIAKKTKISRYLPDAEIIQANDCYPFGMRLNQAPLVETQTNDYLYNGKELQNDLGLELYDYGARIYDPAFARFHTQ